MDVEHQRYAAFGDDPQESVAIATTTLATKLELEPGMYHFVSSVACVFKRGEDGAAAEISDAETEGMYLPGDAYLMDVEVVDGANFFDVVTVTGTGLFRAYRSKRA